MYGINHKCINVHKCPAAGASPRLRCKARCWQADQPPRSRSTACRATRCEKSQCVFGRKAGGRHQRRLGWLANARRTAPGPCPQKVPQLEDLGVTLIGQAPAEKSQIAFVVYRSRRMADG